MDMSTISAIIQARMGSTRLPGKVMKSINGRPMLHWVVSRLQKSRFLTSVVVATPDTPENDDIEDWCRMESVNCFRGSESNVLDRYYEAAKAHHADQVVRITSDCPLIDPHVVDLVILSHLNNYPAPDYTSNTIFRTYPRGLDTEIFPFKSLEIARKQASDPEHLEHVTPYLYTQCQFKNLSVQNSDDYSHLRLTVDAPEDFSLMTIIYKHFGERFFNWREAVSFLHSQPDLLEINRHIKQKKLACEMHSR
ncbi:MAG: glycosyltransferase family protein [Candidatus Omnitrophica bacterium]|nr:glycosyltransferase family protein [Candidatus Omnitrophota bacterium]